MLCWIEAGSNENKYVSTHKLLSVNICPNKKPGNVVKPTRHYLYINYIYIFPYDVGRFLPELHPWPITHLNWNKFPTVCMKYEIGKVCKQRTNKELLIEWMRVGQSSNLQRVMQKSVTIICMEFFSIALYWTQNRCTDFTFAVRIHLKVVLRSLSCKLYRSDVHA